MRRFLSSLLLSLSLAGPCWAAASRNFDATNDDISVSNLPTGSAQTFSAWAEPDTVGEGSAGRIFRHAAGSDADSLWQLLILGTAGQERFRFIAPFTTTQGQWDTPNGSATLLAWQCVQVTWSGTATTTDPVIYINGTSQSLTEVATPAGTFDSGTNTMTIGDDTSDTRTWDGGLAYLNSYSRVLTTVELADACKNPLRTYAANLMLGMLGDSPEVDYSGNGLTGTVNGATASADGPPVFLTSPLSSWRHFWRSFAAWLIPEVYADSIVWCDPLDATVPNRVTRYHPNEDQFKSGAFADPNTLIYSDPISNSPRPWDGVTPPGSFTSWKCDGSDVVAMTQAEQDAINAPAVAEAALQASYDAEVTGNDLCTATLAEIDSRINATRDSLNAEIAGVGNLAQARTVMTSMNNTYAAAFKKVARCVKARLR